MSDDDECCVYTIRRASRKGTVIYIGMTGNFEARLRQHEKAGPISKFIAKNPSVSLHAKVEFTTKRGEAKKIEKRMIQEHSRSRSLLNLAHNTRRKTNIRWAAYLDKKKAKP